MPTPIRRTMAVLLVVLLLPLGAFSMAGCGNDQKASKAEIALRLGLAYGAFKRYVYTPAQTGGFNKGAPKRKRSIAKAALATGFAVHQLRKAIQEAKQDPKLAGLVTKIGASAGSLGGLAAILKGGGGDVSSITGGLSSLDDLFKTAKSNGINAVEQQPSAAQLAAG